MTPNLDTLIAGVMGQAASISMMEIVSSQEGYESQWNMISPL